jgi:hypothetical protein
MNKGIILPILAMTVVSLSAFSQKAKVLDPGGVSIDFSNIKRKNAVTGGPNLIPNGSFEEINEKTKLPKGLWYRNWHIHSSTPDAIALKKKSKNMVIETTVTDNPADGKRCAKLATPISVHNLRKGKKHGQPMMSNGFGVNVRLPKGKALGKCLLTFMLRGKVSSIPGLNSFVVLATPRGGAKSPWKSKPTAKMLNKHFPMTANWRKITVPIMIPKNSDFLCIALKLYGCGEAFIDDVQLRQAASAPGVTIKMMPLGMVDDIYCLASGKPSIIGFAGKNEVEAKIDKPWIYLKLPESVKVIGARNGIDIKGRENIIEDGKKYVLYKAKLRVYRIKKDSYYTWWLMSFLIKTDDKPGQSYPAYYKYVDGTYSTPWNDIHLKVIANAGNTPAPKIFRNAAMFTHEADFEGDAAEQFIDFYKNSGFNSVHGGLTVATMGQKYKKAGIRRYTQLFYLCNGYRIGSKKKPDYALFKLADGSYLTKPHEAICPVEVYTQGQYFKDAVIPMLRKQLVTGDFADEIMSNWEPHMFKFKGCFCDRCKAEFIKYSKIPKADVDKVWPKNVIVKYRNQWIKFRAWQHGKLMKTLEKTINKVGKEAGKDSHFIPEVAWSALTEGGRNHFEQSDPREYMADLKYIEPWGPYVFTNLANPYLYNTGVHLITYQGGKSIRKYVNKYCPNPKKRPGLIAFPHGIQCNTWLTEPEALSFETLGYMLNGWQGSFAYYMPRGYDARWWNSLTEANRKIAAYENYVYKGKRINDTKVTPVTPLPSSNLPKFWSEGGNFVQKLPELKTAKIIQTAEFKLGNKRLVAVGNFWQKGECFLKLSSTELKPAGRYVISQPVEKHCFTPDSKRTYWTGSELNKGVLLHVGALRWAFYVIEPYKANAAYGTAITNNEVKSQLKKRLPIIKKAIRWENQYHKSLVDAESKTKKLPDYSKLKAMRSGNISCTPVKFDNLPALKFVSGQNKVTVVPAIGAQIRSWNNAGQEFLDSSNKGGGLGGDAFWWPRKAVSCSVIETPYAFVSQRTDAKGIRAVFKRKLTIKDSNLMTGATMKKTYNFLRNGSVAIKTEIINSTSKNLKFSYRRRSMSRFMGLVNGKRGRATIADVVFERSFTQKLFRVAKAQDKDIEKVFSMDKLFLAKSKKVFFSAPWFKTKLVFEALDKDKLHCFVFWDGGNQTYATFEAIYKKQLLKPGQSQIIETSWQSK